MNTLTLALPNWDRFSEKYHPDPEFLEALTIRIDSLDDMELKKNILTRINVEIGILLLHDTEIDKKMYTSLLQEITQSKN